MLTVQELAIPDVKLLMPKMHRDERGYLAEIISERDAGQLGLPRFVQDNQSMSMHKNTMRGLHAQKPPHAQAKLVRVLSGAIFDVAVDIRANSKTFGQHVSVVLKAEGDVTQMYIPAGFLHGFCTLTDEVVVQYKVSSLYAPGGEIGTIWNDTDLGIDWPTQGEKVLLSPKDAVLPAFKDLPRLEWA